MTIVPEDVTSVLTLAEVKRHLNFDEDDTTPDDELLGFIPAAFEVASAVVGPLVPVTVREDFVSDGTEFLLAHYPLVDIVSVTRYWGTSGVALDPAEYILDGSLGSVVLPPYGRYRVVYRYGRTDLPASVRLALLELIRHWWQQSQQGLRSVFAQDDGGGGTPMGFAVPARVRELLAPHASLPGIV